MATDILPSTPRRQSVRRCLFGNPDRNDEFMRTRKNMDAAAAQRFKRKWNFDVSADAEDFTSSGEFQWIKSSSESDIPDFYSRGYTHKCRRRAVRPCAGKSLSFMGDSSDDESCLHSRVRSQSPLQFVYDASSIVDVFIGMRMPQQSSTQEPVTPPPTEMRSTHATPDSEDSAALSDISDSPVRSPMQRSLSQTRLTDLWPIRKRARLSTKMERMDSL